MTYREVNSCTDNTNEENPSTKYFTRQQVFCLWILIGVSMLFGKAMETAASNAHTLGKLPQALIFSLLGMFCFAVSLVCIARLLVHTLKSMKE